MTMAGQQYNKVYMLTTFLNGKFSFNLGGNYKSISALIGLDDAAACHDSTLNVLGDGEVIGTYILKPGSLPQKLDLNVTGISKLESQS